VDWNRRRHSQRNSESSAGHPVRVSEPEATRSNLWTEQASGLVSLALGPGISRLPTAAIAKDLLSRQRCETIPLPMRPVAQG